MTVNFHKPLLFKHSSVCGQVNLTFLPLICQQLKQQVVPTTLVWFFDYLLGKSQSSKKSRRHILINKTKFFFICHWDLLTYILIGHLNYFSVIHQINNKEHDLIISIPTAMKHDCLNLRCFLLLKYFHEVENEIFQNHPLLINLWMFLIQNLSIQNVKNFPIKLSENWIL